MRLDFTENEDNTNEKIINNNTDKNTEKHENTDISNVVSNVENKKTTYTKKSFNKSELEKEVWEELNKLEQDEINLINNSKSKEEKNYKKDNNKEIENKPYKENSEINKKAEYGNDIKATASYFLKNRKSQYNPTPSYKCTSEGIVTVEIKVNQKGKVVSVSIDESKTDTKDDCLRNEAISYAQKWKFTQNFNDENRKEGWIKFTYISQ